MRSHYLTVRIHPSISSGTLFSKNGIGNFTLNFEGDVALADKRDHHVLNATIRIRKDSLGRGGKLLLFHDWSDQLISPLNTVNSYESVVKSVGTNMIASHFTNNVADRTGAGLFLPKGKLAQFAASLRVLIDRTHRRRHQEL